MITAVCITLFILFSLIKYFHDHGKHDGREFKELHEIPCPNALPIIGNLRENFLSRDELWKTSRQKALRYYPIYRQKMFHKNMVFLMYPDDIKMILGEPGGSKKGSFYDGLRRITGEGLGANNTEYWKDRRRLLTKCFHFSVVNNLIDLFNEQTDHMVNKLKENLDKCVDIEFHLQKMTLRIITETIFGKLSKITDEDTSKYLDGLKTVTEILMLRTLKPHLSFLWPILKIKKDEDKALRGMYCYTSKAVEENMKRPIVEDNNFANILQLLQSSPELFDNEEIRNEIETFFFAGHGTASRSLSFTIVALANYPHLQERVYQEIKTVIGEKRPTYADLTKMEFLDRFVKESLRLFPPGTIIERTLTKDLITATGFRLPAGTIVLFSIFDIHRNPNLYPEPEVFDPDRFLPENVVKRHKFAYIPFSAGPRNCIAKKYAIWEKKAAICGLLQNFKVEAVTKTENMQFSFDLLLKIRDGFVVKLRKR